MKYSFFIMYTVLNLTVLSEKALPMYNKEDVMDCGHLTLISYYFTATSAQSCIACK